MSIRVVIRRAQILAKIKLQRDRVEEAFERGVELAKGEMIIRTGRGIGVDGNKHRLPYSPSHKRTRAKRSLPTAKVDHMITGQMLQSIDTRIIERNPRRLKIEIFPSATQRLKVFYTNRLRNWFGFGKRERDKIIKTVKTEFKL